MKKHNFNKKTLAPLVSAAAVAIIVIASVNISPVFADKLGDIPVVGNIIKVLTFREFNVNEDNYSGNIVTPKIEGLKNEDLQNSLNRRYIEENKELYDNFMKEVKDLNLSGEGYLGVTSGYIIKTDTDEIFSLGRYVVSTKASSKTEFRYDTISKKNNILITLPSLFKNDSYIEVITKNIKEQMIAKNKEDDSYIYWISEIDESMDDFKLIAPDQSFYITKDNKLVISFNDYEVAPGYMGMVEFTVPTELLTDILVGDEYIR